MWKNVGLVGGLVFMPLLTAAARPAPSPMVSPSQADLVVTKTVGNATPNVGDTVVFTITATNDGPDTATNVMVTDLLPAGMTFVSATTSVGTYNSTTGAWTVGTLAATGADTLQITVTVVSPSAETNTAAIQASEFDPDPNNNTASVTITPQQADLVVSKTVNSATPNVGDTVTFTVTASNNGPNTATNVAITDVLPAGLTFVSATPSVGSYDLTTGVWTLGTVTTSTPDTLQMQAKVVSASAATNTAAIGNADQFDPSTTNNSASVTITPNAGTVDAGSADAASPEDASVDSGETADDAGVDSGETADDAGGGAQDASAPSDAGPVGPSQDAGPAPVSEGGASEEAGPVADAASPEEAGASGDGGSTPSSGGGGCGCETAGTHSTETPSWMLGLGLVAMVGAFGARRRSR